MRLYKNIIFFNRLFNEENGWGVGKCVSYNINNKYFYRDINLNLIKRDTTKNKYYI